MLELEDVPFLASPKFPADGASDLSPEVTLVSLANKDKVGRVCNRTRCGALLQRSGPLSKATVEQRTVVFRGFWPHWPQLGKAVKSSRLRFYHFSSFLE